MEVERRPLPGQLGPATYLLLGLALVCAGCPAGQYPGDPAPEPGSALVVEGPNTTHPWGEPVSDDTTLVLLRNLAYDCGYAPALFVSRWAAYTYTRNAGTGLARHSGSFRTDPRLSPESGPVPGDYQGLWTADLAGYDRGHQAPDATLKVFGPEAQAETYYLTNITPQHSRFNQGIWRELENLARDWAGASDTVWVVTGPVFYAGQETLRLGERARLAKPHAYFQVAARRPEQALALVVPHRSERMPRDSLRRFIVTVDSIERLTGLRLFPGMPYSVRRARPGDWPGLMPGH